MSAQQETADQRGPGGVTQLMHAASLEKEDALKWLLAKFSGDIDEKDDEGYTALHYAALGPFTYNVALLLSAGAYPLCKNNAGETPRDLATKNGRVESSVLLLNAEQSAPLIKPEEVPVRVVELEKLVEAQRVEMEALKAEMLALKDALQQKKPEKAASSSPPSPRPGGTLIK